jgi:hypothetical protein
MKENNAIAGNFSVRHGRFFISSYTWPFSKIFVGDHQIELRALSKIYLFRREDIVAIQKSSLGGFRIKHRSHDAPKDIWISSTIPWKMKQLLERKGWL